VKLSQHGAGVVVTVVMTASQHVLAQQWPVAQTTSSPINFWPLGQVKPLQVGTGVVVTVVQGGGSLWQQVSLQQ
jgi:hypothetical protein